MLPQSLIMYLTTPYTCWITNIIFIYRVSFYSANWSTVWVTYWFIIWLNVVKVVVVSITSLTTSLSNRIQMKGFVPVFFSFFQKEIWHNWVDHLSCLFSKFSIALKFSVLNRDQICCARSAFSLLNIYEYIVYFLNASLYFS